MSSTNNQNDLSYASRGRHTSVNAYGELCMTVVDPVSRKLLIPVQYVFRTRAQQRNTLPSLCLLFLNRRCRQGAECYQVHANREVVQLLRDEIDSLPCCCVAHGDADRTCGPDHPRGSTVIFVPGCKPDTFNGGYLPLTRLSYTVALRRLLQGPTTVSEVVPNDRVIDATGSTICRLHALDRCRYAEDCKFLHVCKEITASNPDLITTTSVNANNGSEEAGKVTPTGESAETPFAEDSSAATANSPSGGRAHVSVFTAVTRRQQQQQHENQRRSVPPAPPANPHPALSPAQHWRSGYGNMPSEGPAGSGHDLYMYTDNQIGTWLAPRTAPPQLPPAGRYHSSGCGTALGGPSPCHSFQDVLPLMASRMPPYMHGVDSSHSLSTVGYSNASFQPLSPVKTADSLQATAATARKPLLVPLSDGRHAMAQVPPFSRDTYGSRGAHATTAGSLDQDCPTYAEVEAQANSFDRDERRSPFEDTTRRRDARDPSRWSYNPYGNQVLSL